ncbi:hypothetical protein T10_12272 [Trichinella papuae]|uniref:Uncharacterized protein n=1 Tax=Trichinella papuae TaxID=268474 RepID=A0A0V1LX32_9BILA|nr:hypothetical protein T10_12272 [Trichinella papuae]
MFKFSNHHYYRLGCKPIAYGAQSWMLHIGVPILRIMRNVKLIWSYFAE